MELTFKKLTKGLADWERLKALNAEAFPPEERMSPERMLLLGAREDFDFSAVYDSGQFIGFYILMIKRPSAYLFFLAVDSRLRSRGYGGRILECLRKKYAGCQIVLDMEILDERAENLEQRKARKKFYLRNGYHETGYFMKYNGVVMEVLCSEENFMADCFQELLNSIGLRKRPLSLHYGCQTLLSETAEKKSGA